MTSAWRKDAGPASTVRLSQTIRAAWPGVLLCALSLLPFLHSAFTIDDTVFLLEAEHAMEHPLAPPDFEIVWFDRPESISALQRSGRMMAWLLIPSILAGGSEWVAHLTQIILFSCGILATVIIALRCQFLLVEARLAGLLVAATPACLGIASTSMPDIAAMTFGVLGAERLTAWLISKRWHQPALGLMFLGLGAYSRVHIAPLAVVLSLACLLLQQRQAAAENRPDMLGPVTFRQSMLPWGIGLLLPCAVLAALWLRTFDVVSALRLFRPPYIASNAVAFLVHWAVAVPLVIPWLVIRGHVINWKLAPFLGVPVFAALIWLHREARVSVALVAIVSLLCLIDIIKYCVSRRTWFHWVLLAWLFVPLPVIIYPHFPSKYLVVSVPAVALLLIEAMRSSSSRLKHVTIAITLIAGATLGIAIVSASAALAEPGRMISRELIAPLAQQGRRVWFHGHWGFQWYAQRAGARPLASVPPFPQPNDIIVASSSSAYGASLDQVAPHRTLLGKAFTFHPGGRVMGDGAGFFPITGVIGHGHGDRATSIK